MQGGQSAVADRTRSEPSRRTSRCSSSEPASGTRPPFDRREGRRVMRIASTSSGWRAGASIHLADRKISGARTAPLTEETLSAIDAKGRAISTNCATTTARSSSPDRSRGHANPVRHFSKQAAVRRRRAIPGGCQTWRRRSSGNSTFTAGPTIGGEGPPGSRRSQFTSLLALCCCA